VCNTLKPGEQISAYILYSIILLLSRADDNTGPVNCLFIYFVNITWTTRIDKNDLNNDYAVSAVFSVFSYGHLINLRIELSHISDSIPNGYIDITCTEYIFNVDII
jgi:hypothetical protein